MSLITCEEILPYSGLGLTGLRAGSAPPHSLVVIVGGHCQTLLGQLLTNHMLVQEPMNLKGREQLL